MAAFALAAIVVAVIVVVVIVVVVIVVAVIVVAVIVLVEGMGIAAVGPAEGEIVDLTGAEEHFEWTVAQTVA